MRRIYTKKRKADRSVERILVGSPSDIAQEFKSIRRRIRIRNEHGIDYAYEVKRTPDEYTAFESFYVQAPVTVASKTRSGFDRFDDKWNRLNLAQPIQTIGLVRRQNRLPLPPEGRRDYGQTEFFLTDDDGYSHCFGVPKS